MRNEMWILFTLFSIYFRHARFMCSQFDMKITFHYYFIGPKNLLLYFNLLFTTNFWFICQQQSNHQLFSKDDITKQNDPKHISLPLNRRPLSIKQSSGESSQSPLPPSSPSTNMAWIGAAAAILVGGGVYLVSRSKGKSDSSHGKAKAHVPPKKRKNFITK